MLEQFEVAFRANTDAFNRGDFATAFAGLAPECEWFSVEEAPESTALVGPEEVCRFFERLVETFPDWRVEPVRVLQAGDGVFVALFRAGGSGRASGARATIALAHVWELRNGVPVRVREFSHWEDALSAVGLDQAAVADIRADKRPGD